MCTVHNVEFFTGRRGLVGQCSVFLVGPDIEKITQLVVLSVIDKYEFQKELGIMNQS